MNAVEAMASVDTREGVLKVTSELQKPGNILITVQDTGTGIDPKDRDRIFDALFSTKPSRMGIGLLICRIDHQCPRWAPLGIRRNSIRIDLSPRPAD